MYLYHLTDLTASVSLYVLDTGGRKRRKLTIYER